MDEIIKDWQENASTREDHNFMFLTSLKFKNPKKVERLVKDLHKEAFEKIDCLKCGNCCKTLKPTISKEDIKRISNHFNEDESIIKAKYLEKDKGGDWTFNKLPCPFLKEGNVCEIYQIRPKVCQEFPHTQKKGFTSRRFMHTSNTKVCPATYYIVERMQKLIR